MMGPSADFRFTASRFLAATLPVSTLLAAVVMTSLTPAPAEADPAAERRLHIDDFFELGKGARVIAHRGFSGVTPENTLVAVRRAIDIGADMVEIDVLLSRDGHVVVFHDDTLDRTTEGEGPIADLSLAEIRSLEAGSWFGEEFAGEKVPTLAEVLDLVHGRILLNIEIKGEAVTSEIEDGIVDKVLEMVAEREMGDAVVLSSFEPEALRHARELDPEIRTASLLNDRLHRGMTPLEVMDAVGSTGFNLSARQVDREIVDLCHRHGRPVAVYTVNDEAAMRKLVALGVDAIFTDRPDRMLQVLGRHENDEP